MVVELSVIGVFVGILSGFFGIGGGTILVPVLLFLGYDMKTAIGISVIQMVFSSVYGSYLNFKKGTLDLKMVSIIGFGGFFGALLSALIVSRVNAFTLEVLFFAFVIFALARMYVKTQQYNTVIQPHPALLFLIGTAIGLFSISIGVGGSILLVPILVGFLHVNLKNAISAGLFFVVFSSISGVIGLSMARVLDYESGMIIGLASLLGVLFGIHMKHQVNDDVQKKLLLLFYIAVALYLFIRLVGNG
ncbi:MAG: sulfite exporter TauE/SafE family protein [Sulfurimonas sp.]|nr:MAG: sulfite exporter TauE/SafE family protein [Sulfurimonas sp.]